MIAFILRDIKLQRPSRIRTLLTDNPTGNSCISPRSYIVIRLCNTNRKFKLVHHSLPRFFQAYVSLNLGALNQLHRKQCSRPPSFAFDQQRQLQPLRLLGYDGSHSFIQARRHCFDERPHHCFSSERTLCLIRIVIFGSALGVEHDSASVFELSPPSSYLTARDRPA